MTGKKNKIELPKYETWKAPWEVDASGNDIPVEEQKFDADKARKLIFDRTVDKIRVQNSLAETTERAEELESQVADAADPAALKEVQDKLTKALAERDNAKSGNSLELARMRVALEKGLTLKQAQRLHGEDEDELSADADDLLEELGISKSKKRGKADDEDDDEDDDDKEDTGIRSRPKSRLRTSGDPDPDSTRKKEPTPDEVYAMYQSRR